MHRATRAEPEFRNWRDSFNCGIRVEKPYNFSVADAQAQSRRELFQQAVPLV